MTAKLSLLSILLLYMVTSLHGALPCKLRVNLARAEQTDEHGRKCWDTVKVPSCGGRCDSREPKDCWTYAFSKHHNFDRFCAFLRPAQGRRSTWWEAFQRYVIRYTVATSEYFVTIGHLFCEKCALPTAT